MAAKLGFLIFFKFVRIVESCVALHRLIAGKFAAELCNRPITGRMAFLFSVNYRIAVTLRAGRAFKFFPVDFHIDAFLLALLADIPEELRKGYIVTFNFNTIISHGVGLLKDMFYFCE